MAIADAAEAEPLPHGRRLANVGAAPREVRAGEEGPREVNRRASLPTADELFGLGSREQRPPTPTEPDPEPVDGRAFAALRRVTAPEGPAVHAARERAGGVVDVPQPEIGALLRWAVTTSGARTVVELGAAGGVSGLWLLSALPERGVLTSIEVDPHAHDVAKETFRSVGAGTRVRSILGDAASVLPRLSDGGYDLAILQGAASGYPEELGHVRRLLRPGGMLVARRVLRRGDDDDALTRFLQELVEDAAFDAVVLPIDDGLALATRLDGGRLGA